MVKQANDKKGLYFKKKNKERIATLDRVLSAVRAKLLPAIKIDGWNGYVVTQSDVDSFLKKTPDPIESNFKTKADIKSEIANSHPELCITDKRGKPLLFDNGGEPTSKGGTRKLKPSVACEISQSLKKLVELKLLEMKKVTRERNLTVAETFISGQNGKQLPSGFVQITRLKPDIVYDSPRFLEFLKAFDKHVDKAKELAAQGKALPEIKTELEEIGVVGVRLRRVLIAAELAQSRAQYLASFGSPASPAVANSAPAAPPAAKSEAAIGNGHGAAPAADGTTSKPTQRGRKHGFIIPAAAEKKDLMRKAWRAGEYETIQALADAFHVDRTTASKALSGIPRGSKQNKA